MSTTKDEILIVNDTPDILEIIEYKLKKEGFKVYRASQSTGRKKAASHVDLMVVDIMMSTKDGLEACRIMRAMPEFKNTFMIFLTGRRKEYLEIAGFNEGADNFITNPIKHRALVSRFLTVLKPELPPGKNKLKIADLIIDKETFLVHRGNERIVLAKKEFALLYFLASHPGKVYSREDILRNAWQDLVVIERTIDVHVRRIRKKLGGIYIITVQGVGYKFEI